MKQIKLTIPAKLNSSIDRHLIDIREIGVKTTKAELCVKLIEIGLSHELRGNN